MLLFLAISIAVLSAMLFVASCVLLVREWNRKLAVPLASLMTLLAFGAVHASDDVEAKAKAKAKALALLSFSEPLAPLVTAPSGWLTDYTVAQRVAVTTGKPLLVYLRSATCIHCDRLERGPFQSPSVRNALVSIVAAKLDAKDAVGLVKALKVTAFPTFVLAAPDGTILRSATGYMDAGPLVEWLRGPKSLPVPPLKGGAAVTPAKGAAPVVVINGCGCDGDPTRCTCQVCRCKP